MQDAAEALMLMLQLEGYEVAGAFDGLQAIQISESFRPHGAVLDIGMPGIDGYGVARHIGKTPWGRSIHLIAFTGRNDQSSRALAATAGFHQYIVKPIDPPGFIKIIANIKCPA
jgi:two-component system, sensor histidine kinase